MKSRSPIVSTLAACCLLSLSAHAADPTIDRLIASQCAQCHGTDGRSAGGIDSLLGEADEILEEMSEMQMDNSPDDIMEHQARGYTQQQVIAIARYFRSL